MKTCMIQSDNFFGSYRRDTHTVQRRRDGHHEGRRDGPGQKRSNKKREAAAVAAVSLLCTHEMEDLAQLQLVLRRTETREVQQADLALVRQTLPTPKQVGMYGSVRPGLVGVWSEVSTIVCSCVSPPPSARAHLMREGGGWVIAPICQIARMSSSAQQRGRS